MEARQSGKLDQVVFERLVAGESREALRADLMKRLNGAEADEVLGRSYESVAKLLASEEGSAEIGRVRKRRIEAMYPLRRILGWGLVVWGALLGVSSLVFDGSVAMFLPLLTGSLVLMSVEFDVRKRVLGAEEAIDQILGSSASTRAGDSGTSPG